jgi:hypothetical protein
MRALVFFLAIPSGGADMLLFSDQRKKLNHEEREREIKEVKRRGCDVRSSREENDPNRPPTGGHEEKRSPKGRVPFAARFWDLDYNFLTSTNDRFIVNSSLILESEADNATR